MLRLAVRVAGLNAFVMRALTSPVDVPCHRAILGKLRLGIPAEEVSLNSSISSCSYVTFSPSLQAGISRSQATLLVNESTSEVILTTADNAKNPTRVRRQEIPGRRQNSVLLHGGESAAVHVGDAIELDACVPSAFSIRLHQPIL